MAWKRTIQITNKHITITTIIKRVTCSNNRKWTTDWLARTMINDKAGATKWVDYSLQCTIKLLHKGIYILITQQLNFLPQHELHIIESWYKKFSPKNNSGYRDIDGIKSTETSQNIMVSQHCYRDGGIPSARIPPLCSITYSACARTGYTM